MIKRQDPVFLKSATICLAIALLYFLANTIFITPAEKPVGEVTVYSQQAK